MATYIQCYVQQKMKHLSIVKAADYVNLRWFEIWAHPVSNILEISMPMFLFSGNLTTRDV